MTVETQTFDGWPGLPDMARGDFNDIADEVFDLAPINMWALGFWTCAIHYFSPKHREMLYIHTTDEADTSPRITATTLRRTHIRFMRQAKQQKTSLAVRVLEVIRQNNFSHYIQLVGEWEAFCDRRHKNGGR